MRFPGFLPTYQGQAFDKIKAKLVMTIKNQIITKTSPNLTIVWRY